ncbi:probable serine/threonine-protein kinase tsuA [Drosophila subpulchrella]|uniref:probable serine/threonine-protein kinase tsuA n=1 Tax=Drosophila subpulchrella TaxID=1486046 RepID=UPI0018A145A7|nr:probable serine/threonine-protein kinase tsuA [Drosophila subpulchrella]
MLLQFTLPNVRTFIILMVVVAFVRPACAAKNVLTLSKHSELALHINSHGKVTAENILRTYQYFTMEAVNDVFSLDFKITIYSADVDYYLCFHQGRLVGKKNATKDCHFKEGIFMGNHHFTSAYNPNLRVGFKGNFKPIGLNDFAKPKVMKKAILYFFPVSEERFNSHLAEVLRSTTTTTTTTTTTSTTTTTTTTPPSTKKISSTTTTTTTASPVAVTKRTRSKSRRPTSINSDSSNSNIPEKISNSNSLKTHNQANSNNNNNNNNNELDLQQQQVILQRNRKQHRRQRLQQKRQQQLQHRRRHRQYGTVGVMAQPQPKNLVVRHHHNNATIMERRRRRRLERQQHKLQRELWEQEQREAGERERERERVEHLPKATSSASSSSSSSSTATSTALTATAASLAPSAFNLVAIMAASRRKRDRRKRSAGATGGGATVGAGSARGGNSGNSPPDADMQLVELPSQRLQQQDDHHPQNEYSKPYVNSNLNLNLNVNQLIDSSSSANVNHAIPALPKNYNYLYSNEHYNLNTKSSTTDSSSLDDSTKFDSPNSHSHSHSPSPSHSHSAFNQNIDNNLKQLNDRIDLVSTENQVETSVTEEGDTETVTTATVVQNRNHIDANNIIDDSYPNDEEHEELILKKLLRGLHKLQQQHVQQQHQQQQQHQRQPNIDNPNENINVVNDNQNHNDDSGLLTNNNHNSNYNEQFANDDETIRIQNNKYETHIVQYKHAVVIWKIVGGCLQFFSIFSKGFGWRRVLRVS